jgi:hypothetical protein
LTYLDTVEQIVQKLKVDFQRIHGLAAVLLHFGIYDIFPQIRISIPINSIDNTITTYGDFMVIMRKEFRNRLKDKVEVREKTRTTKSTIERYHNAVEERIRVDEDTASEMIK